MGCELCVDRHGIINKGGKTLNEFLIEDYPKQNLVKRYDLYVRLSTANFNDQDEKELLDFIDEIKTCIRDEKIEVSMLPIIEQNPSVIFTHLLEALSSMKVKDLRKQIM